MRLVRHSAVLLSTLLIGCGFDIRSAQYSCESTSDCETGRTCDLGWCVVAGDVNDLPDAGPGTVPASDGGTDPDAQTTTTPPDAQTMTPDAAPMPGTITYVASIADCVDLNVPDPDVCETENGAGQIAVDLEDSVTLSPWGGYVRFDTGGEFAGKTVTAVTLRLTITDDAKAPAPASGQIFRVAPFVRNDLFSTAPATIGAALGSDQGSVKKNDVLDWSLPISIVSPNAGVFIGIMPTATDGTNYWNLTGPNPPKLIVDYL